MKLTQIQIAVVNAKMNDGYENFGIYNSVSFGGVTVCLVKGRSRLQINCLGYDEYTGNAMAYKEIK